MPLFPRRTDPLQQRAKELNSEIARLEKELRTLARPEPASSRPAPAPRPRRMPERPTPTAPPTPTSTHTSPPGAGRPRRTSPAPAIPRLSSPVAPAAPIPTDDHYNASGLRKFDLSEIWKRVSRHLHGPTTNNPRMVQYLAVGSVQGLRPLRYEKRIARNRFIGLFVLLLAILWGLTCVYLHQTRPRTTPSVTPDSFSRF